MTAIPDYEVIEKLFEYGHFFCEEAMGMLEVKKEYLPTLSIDDKVVKAALRSFQSYMAPAIDHIALKYGRPLTPHIGELDDSTRLSFGVPRCGHPDILHPDVRAKLSGTGSWPEPCQKQGVKYNVNKSGCPIPDTIDAVIADVVAAYGSVGLKMVAVSTSAEANIQCYFTGFMGSVIGLSEFNNGSCKNQVYSKISNTYRGYNRSLILHEWGHCCNLEHTRGGIMNPYILPDPSPFTWHHDDPSYPVLQRFFGGQPVDPPAPPVPAPTPTPHPAPGPTPFGFMRLPASITDADGNSYQMILLPKSK